jgi:hypothetical protein
MTSTDFIALLEQHDWYYDRSDDNRAYSKGAKSRDKLLYLCQQQPELFRLYNHADNCILRSLPFDFQSVIGKPMTVEKQQIQTTTPMNPELIRIIRAAALAVVNECDALSSAPPPTTPPPAAEKPAKAAKAKTAPPPAKEEEPAVVISEARLKATVTTLPNEGKLKLKAYFQKKFGYNTMAEIAEENRADIHAAAVKIGATDTDPDADVDLG